MSVTHFVSFPFLFSGQDGIDVIIDRFDPGREITAGKDGKHNGLLYKILIVNFFQALFSIM